MITPKVASRHPAGKFIGIAVIAVVAVILVLGFFTNKASVPQKNAEPPVNISDNNSAQLDLNYAANPNPAPLPVKKILPPPPSVLPTAGTNYSLPVNDDIRLKSPTQVYSVDNSAANAPVNPAGNSTDPNNGFAQQAANAAVVTVSAKQESQMDYKILQGKFISAVLETSINSDMPGMVRAIVSKDVYSDTGKLILLPRGTRLIGIYNSAVATGQTRVMVVWTRALTPQHLDIALGSPSADRLGQSGMEGTVDSHFWEIFGASALLSTLGATASNMNPGSSSGTAGVSGNPYQLAVTQGMINASSDVLQQRINIKPTIRIEQGTVIQVFVARDLDFSKVTTANPT